jgi:hypothetical protein
MSLSAVVETAFGLIFVFFLFSLIASGINETIGRWTKRRARFLERGLWRLLGNDLDRKDPPKGEPTAGEPTTWYTRFWEHALVRQLAEPGKKRPSYLPSRTFAAVVGNLFQQDVDAGTGALAMAPPELQESLVTLLEAAQNDANRLRDNIEHWFDAEMDRVSGWYKRHTHRWLFVISLALVLIVNIDTVSIARTLWTDPQVRATVTAAAEADLAANATTTTVAGAPAPAAGTTATTATPLVACSPTSSETTTSTSTTGTTTVLKAATSCATALPLPVGWPKGSAPKTAGDWALKLLGWAVTIGALVLGAPFWWDLLNRFGSLKQAGPTPASTSTETP